MDKEMSLPASCWLFWITTQAFFLGVFAKGVVLLSNNVHYFDHGLRYGFDAISEGAIIVACAIAGASLVHSCLVIAQAVVETRNAVICPECLDKSG